MNTEPTGSGRYARRAQPAKHLTPILVGMPKELINQLDKEATHRGLDSRAELVRMACRAILEKAAA